MALYAKTAGGNWSAAATWSATSSAGVDNAGPPTAATDVIFELGSGNVTVDATSVAKTVSMTAGTGNYTGTLTHNAFSLTVSGSLTFSSGMTYTPLATSTLSFNASATLTTAGKLIPLLTHTSGTLTLGDNLNFMASKVITMTLSGTAVSLASFTISGNSAINRVLIKSNTVGTGAQITIGTGTFAYADFQDITFSSASNLDLSAITGLSGDCGGNTLTGGGTTLTFTASSPQTCTMSSNQNWSTVGIWTTRVPLPQDDVVMTGVTGGTLTADMPRLGRSINWTGATGSPTWAFSSTTNTIYGSITLISGMTISGTQSLTFAGRGNYSITSAGNTFTMDETLTAPTGTYLLNDSFINNVKTISLTNGTLNTNGVTVTTGLISSTGSATRSLTCGSSNINFTVTSGSIWNVSSSLTLSALSANFIISTVSSSTRTMQIQGLTYGTITYTVAGSTGELDFANGGTSSFAAINFSDASNARSLKFTAGTTTTIRSGNGFNVQGTSGKLMTVTSITGAAFTMTSTQQQSCDYLSLTNSVVNVSPVWYAGANSTDNGGNTNWIFTAAPVVAGGSQAGSGSMQANRALLNLRNLI